MGLDENKLHSQKLEMCVAICLLLEDVVNIFHYKRVASIFSVYLYKYIICIKKKLQFLPHLVELIYVEQQL